MDFTLEVMDNSHTKPLKGHPESWLAKMMPKILEDKKWLNAYLRGEISKEELESKGVKLVKHV